MNASSLQRKERERQLVLGLLDLHGLLDVFIVIPAENATTNRGYLHVVFAGGATAGRFLPDLFGSLPDTAFSTMKLVLSLYMAFVEVSLRAAIALTTPNAVKGMRARTIVARNFTVLSPFCTRIRRYN